MPWQDELGRELEGLLRDAGVSLDRIDRKIIAGRLGPAYGLAIRSQQEFAGQVGYSQPAISARELQLAYALRRARQHIARARETRVAASTGYQTLAAAMVKFGEELGVAV